MKRTTCALVIVVLLGAVDVAHAEIVVTKARIGCLDIQTSGNMTDIVGRACNGKQICPYKAPTEDAYKKMGVQARTRSYCSQGMEITYHCGQNDFHTVRIAGDAWNNPPAQLVCTPPPSAHVPKPGLITVSGARIGCLDIQTDMNLTPFVAVACNDEKKCSYKAPKEDDYKSWGVEARTRLHCTQAMEIIYQCGNNDFHSVMVEGDAWDKPAAVLDCNMPAPSTTAATDTIHVSKARIGCLDEQQGGNLTSLVANACNGKPSCPYKAPTEAEYKAKGVTAKTRPHCTQAMEITYDCGRDDSQKVLVPGDAWNHPPALLFCNPPPISPGQQFPAGTGAITITKARIGCLDEQQSGNLTQLVGRSCNNRLSCLYQAPTEAAYKAAGVTAKTRTSCTQAMEIRYRCGANDEQVVTVEGNAWDHGPAELICDGKTIATNHQDMTPPQDGPAPTCTPVWTQDPAAATEYLLAPSAMLDWTMTESKGDYTLQGFRPPQSATREMYRAKPGAVQGAPGSTLGANEGRLRSELREVARMKDPLAALCRAAQRFTRNGPAPELHTPSDFDFGKAFADLSVSGKASFDAFVRLSPTAATLRAHAGCAGASDQSINQALDRAYQVAAALRLPHASQERKALGWIAVSGEDDQPYRPVNVPGTSYPQFHLRVDPPGWNIPANTRYLIAHRDGRAPQFPRSAKPMVNGGARGRTVPADAEPAFADDAQVILFIHGMDSKAEEAEHLAHALHALPDKKNWTVLSLDLPTSGYADNIDPGRIGSADKVSCHKTRVLDYIEDYIVAFVDALDAKVRGRLKPRIKAVVGGSLGGNMTFRLHRRDSLAVLDGKRPDTTWLTHVVSWSPAAIWPSMIAQSNCHECGCDTGWDETKDRAVNLTLRWSGRGGGGGVGDRFLPSNELEGKAPELRRELFYGGFDWDSGLLVEIFAGKGHKAQASCWYSDRWRCKDATIAGARLDRQETYDANFRVWHWRLASEQLAFSQRLNTRPGLDEYEDPLYLYNTKPMLLLCGIEDVCVDLCKHTRDVAARMANTPGYARFLNLTGHSIPDEYPGFVARELAAFLDSFPAGVTSESITVTRARIGCLDIQTSGNLTSFVAGKCNGRKSCSYKAPTEDEYKRLGIDARTRVHCTQAMEITYQCGQNDFRTAKVPGDAWDHPAADLSCLPR